MIVKYSCGCIGLPPDDRGKSIIFEACDSQDYDPCGAVSRVMGSKATWEPLSSIELPEFLAKLHNLILDGYDMRDIRRILNRKP